MTRWLRSHRCRGCLRWGCRSRWNSVRGTWIAGRRRPGEVRALRARPAPRPPSRKPRGRRRPGGWRPREKRPEGARPGRWRPDGGAEKDLNTTNAASHRVNADKSPGREKPWLHLSTNCRVPVGCERLPRGTTPSLRPPPGHPRDTTPSLRLPGRRPSFRRCGNRAAPDSGWSPSHGRPESPAAPRR